MFTIGGLSGVTHAVAPADTQQTDTYYIVAHFHYVLFGGAFFGFFGGIYFWWPKVFGYLLNEKLGKWNFWLMLHRLQPDVRADAHPRPAGHDRGAPTPTTRRLRLRLLEHGRHDRRLHHLAVGIAVLPLQHLLQHSAKAKNLPPTRARSVGRPHARVDDPVAAARAQLRRGPDGRRTLDEFWHRKYGEDENGRLVRIAETEDVVQKGDATDVHLPSPSYWPIVARLRPAAHRLRPDLQPVAVRRSVALISSPASTAGSSSRRTIPSRRTATTTTPDDEPDGRGDSKPADEPTRRRRAAASADPTRGGRRPLADTTTDAESRSPQVRDGADRRRSVTTSTTITNTGISNEKLAMWVFLASECLLFGGLISTYLLYKDRRRHGGPTPHELYDIPFTSVSSFVLLMSSLTMVLAVVGHPARRPPPRCASGSAPPRCSARCSSPARSTSSPCSSTRAWATRPTPPRRRSTP